MPEYDWGEDFRLYLEERRDPPFEVTEVTPSPLPQPSMGIFELAADYEGSVNIPGKIFIRSRFNPRHFNPEGRRDG